MKSLAILSLSLMISSLSSASVVYSKYMCVGLDDHKDITNPLYFVPAAFPTEIGTANGFPVNFSIQGREIILTVDLDKQHDKYVYIGATAGGAIRYGTQTIRIDCLPVP